MSSDERPEPVPALRLQDTLRLSAEGVAKVLGDLETRVMNAVWQLHVPASARTVHERVADQHPVALHTVITVLNKLVAKGLLSRRKSDDVFHYRACYTEAEFRNAMSRRAIEGILTLSPQAVAASFVDILAERDPAQLTELLELVQRRLKEEG